MSYFSDMNLNSLFRVSCTKLHLGLSSTYLKLVDGDKGNGFLKIDSIQLN